MAIAEDASTPAVATKVSNTTGLLATASFSPPAATMVVVLVSVGYLGAIPAATYTVTDSLSNTYTAGPFVGDTQFDWAGVFTRYYTTAPGAITVTAHSTSSAASGWQVAARVVTGAAATQTGAATKTAFSSAGSTVLEGSVTTTTAGSWVYLAGAVDETPTSITPAAGTTTINDFNDTTDTCSPLAGRQAAATVTPGATTLGWTLSVAGQWAFAALEILPGAAAASVGPRRITQIPNPAVTRAAWY